MTRGIGAVARAVMLACACVAAMPAAAQEKSATRSGFTIAPGSAARILLLRPGIRVGAQSTAGMFEPNADWTEQAKSNIGHALDAAEARLGNHIIAAEEPVGLAAGRLADYRALFSTVAQAVITYQFFPGNRLPTKKRDKGLDYTLGAGVKDIPGAAQADYILFLNTEDAYGSTGRKIFQIMAAMGGVGIASGVHKGFAGLVDAQTGDLVWLNADLAMGGDVRTPEGATKRVAELLQGFPGSRPEPVKVAAQ